MITEAQFTDAMERAVAERGATWRYPDAINAPHGYYAGTMTPYYAETMTPTYSDAEGNPTCLIGVVLHLLGKPVPTSENSPSCLSFLMGYTHIHVTLAARCAQMHQDQRRPWGEALAIYRTALDIQQVKRDYTPFTVNDLYREARMQVVGDVVAVKVAAAVKSMEELEAAFHSVGTTANSITFNGFAAGGIISQGSFGPTTIAALHTYSGATAITFAEVFQPTKALVPTKAQHALTA